MVKKVETPLQRQQRLEVEKQKREQKKLQETPESRAARLEKRRQRRRNESPATRAARLEKQRQINAERRRGESPTSYASRLEKQHENSEKKIRKESPASRAARLERERQMAEKRRRNESPASRAARLEKQRQITEKRRRNESPASRAARLEKQRQITEKRRRNESPATRAARLEKRRQTEKKRGCEEFMARIKATSHVSRLEKHRQIAEKGRQDESPSCTEQHFVQSPPDEDCGNDEFDTSDTEGAFEEEALESNSSQDLKIHLIHPWVNIDVNNCNDGGCDNTAEPTYDICNKVASGIKLEYAPILSDKEDYSGSTQSGDKPFLSHRAFSNPKDFSTNIITKVEVNAAIENTSDSNIEILNKSRLDVGPNPSEPFGKYQCFLCALNFAEKNDLTSHLLKHFARCRPYVCHICEKSFPTLHRLKRHVNCYADICEYKCDQCNEAFKTSWNLSQHKRYSHNGMSPYKCSKCYYQTFIRPHLISHMDSHRDVRPFKCNYCSYASKRQSYLLTHEKKHKESKRYKCDICYSRFVKVQKLRVHRKTHFVKGLLVHRCRFCPSELSSPDELRTHVNNFHRDEVLK